MTAGFYAKLGDLGLSLPDAPAPAANYVPYVLSGNLVFVSGQISIDDEGELIVAQPENFVWSGAAPNLSKFMTRNTFAGATWDLLIDRCRDDVWEADPSEFGDLYLEGVTLECLNEIDLKEWLRNAPAKKPMYTDPENLEPTDDLVRGMPNLALSEDQINELVAYLLERK